MKPNHHWIFPDAVSDETAVALSMFLYDLAGDCERRYASMADILRFFSAISEIVE